MLLKQSNYPVGNYPVGNCGRGNYLGGNYPVENYPGAIILGGNCLGVNCPGGNCPVAIKNWGGRTQIERSQNGANISRKNSNVSKLFIHAKAHNIITNLLS